MERFKLNQLSLIQSKWKDGEKDDQGKNWIQNNHFKLDKRTKTQMGKKHKTEEENDKPRESLKMTFKLGGTAAVSDYEDPKEHKKKKKKKRKRFLKTRF